MRVRKAIKNPSPSKNSINKWRPVASLPFPTPPPILTILSMSPSPSKARRFQKPSSASAGQMAHYSRQPDQTVVEQAGGFGVARVMTEGLAIDQELVLVQPRVERDCRRVGSHGVRTGHGERPFLPVGERADQGDRLRRRSGAVVEGDLVPAVRESLRGAGIAEREVLLGEGEKLAASDGLHRARLVAHRRDATTPIRVVRILG